MSSICRYIQLGIYVRGYTDKATHNFKREIAEVTEFYVDSDTNKAGHNVIYRKGADGKVIRNNPSPYLIDYLEVQGVFLPKELQNMAGETEEGVDNIQEALSESDISDDQTVTFSSNGATIQAKASETENSNLNFNINSAEFNNSPVTEISPDNVISNSIDASNNTATEVNSAVLNNGSNASLGAQNTFNTSVNAQNVARTDDKIDNLFG